MKSATEQYGELETKHKESELAHEEIIAKKNECIEMLKKELETANEIIENSIPDETNKDIEGNISIKNFHQIYRVTTIQCLFFRKQ